ncbi:Actin-like protein ARP6 [Trametes pubescens]|uniref:Actin-like protein ARP6 n=1 Tax=Trametes pubescens TaxID=154538 RepID=A0A1M2VQR6_TRAPU|nr:Actin-like protein ARP6 [Trametes pubescens]
MSSSNTVLLDNGASTIKAGILGGHDDQPLIIPNAVVRSKGDNSTYIGYELAKCRDFTSLRFRLPFEKGFLVDWDAQKAVWDGLFNDVLRINTSEASLLITEPYFNLPNIQDIYDQFIFEEYEFKAYHRCTQIVSFRQWNMMDETHIINEVKEACCFVSEDFKRDLEACRVQPTKNRIAQEYIFPDYAGNRPGRIRRPGEPLDEAEQTLTMNNERFAVPEILFHPTDIGEYQSPDMPRTAPGLDQAGISATVAASISLLPQDLQGLFWANIALIGGTTALPGLRARLTSELRSLAPIDCEVAVYASERPDLEAYYAAAAFAARPEFSQSMVTREEYQEMGSSACRRKFRDWKPTEKEPAARGRETAKGRGQKGRGQQEDEEDASPPQPKKPTRGRGRGRGSARRQA